MQTTEALIALLELEQIDVNIFRGDNYKAPWGRVFGGQVMAQAAHAARRTVPDDRFLHSLHGYFILGGDINVPIIFLVDTIRDGRSFTTRRVVAKQKGRAIFNLAASFQKREDGFEHQINMPNVPGPEAVITDRAWAEQYKEVLPDLYQRYQVPRPIEFRPVEKYDPVNRRNQRPFRHIWLRATGDVPDDLALNKEILAYASDYNLMGTSLLPHRAQFDQQFMQMASLDHAMWFYNDFKVNEWLLYALDSPAASGSRGLNRGNFFNQEGKLVASVVQEGLIRYRQPKEME